MFMILRKQLSSLVSNCFINLILAHLAYIANYVHNFLFTQVQALEDMDYLQHVATTNMTSQSI